MEDAHICMPSIKPGASPTSAWARSALFGVLDGHGGEQVAKFSSLHLAEELRKFPLEPGKQKANGELENALRGAFHRIDDMLRDTKYQKELQSLTNVSPHSDRVMAARPVDVKMVGCTACVCCITPEQLVCANAGDSRAVLCRAGKAIPLSEDHKPNDPREKRRIEKGGGYVENSAPGQYRVNGNLNLSRALGDLEYKKDTSRKPEEQIICSTPDVTFFERDAEADEFLVICCDGVWDVKTNQEVVDFLRQRLPPRGQVVEMRAVERALEELLDACVSPDLRLTRGLGGDNMTVVVVILPPSSKDQACPPSACVGHRSDGKRPKLIRVQCLATEKSKKQEVSKAAAKDAGEGWLKVHLALPMGLCLHDLSLGVSKDKAQIEVAYRDGGLSDGVHSVIFDLQSELPEDACLRTTAEPAKLTSSSGSLRLLLPWRCPS
eukprot:TRINITY_DN47801_c0_g1_i1.p1 TRINITY_DN47801_c0_g1~~TRINITY_DN47801_c0_g1_i1.p1  ORF type:complete len:489 (+),score=96.24 TRINITY_DN47801_c0_g1_i1:160-1467(+)